MNERSFTAVWIAFVFSLIGLAAAVSLMPSNSRGAIAFDLQATTAGIMKLYIDRGRGFNESDTVSAVVGATHNSRIVLRLPFDRFKAIRLDPDLDGGSFQISNLTVSGDFGIKPMRVEPEPYANFPVSIRNNVISGEVPTQSFDPQIILTKEPRLLASKTSSVRKTVPFLLPVAAFLGTFLLLLKWPLPIHVGKYTVVFAAIVLPFLIFFDLSLLGYWIVKPGWMPSVARLGSSGPVADPAAGAFQDFPWLTYLGKSISQGGWPLVNVYNGTGAPLLESLQSGVLYPLNLLLPLFNVSKPDFFGLFMLLHVSILVGGCYLIAKRYCEWKLAVAVSVSFALSPLTFSALNMVHLRAFVWMPYLAWSLIRIANREKVANSICFGAAATATSLAAGNPQETILGILASLVIFISEKIRVSGSAPPKSLLIPCLVAATGILIGLPTILPYFISKTDGSLASVQSLSRSATFIGWDWWPAVVIPSFQGVWPNLLKTSKSHDEFALFAIAPTVTFLILCSICAPRLVKNHKNDLIAFCVILAAVFIGYLQIFGGIPLNPIRFVPLLNTIRITKYINYLNLLLFFGACLSCMLLEKSDERVRSSSIRMATSFVAVVIILAAGMATLDPTYAITPRRLQTVAPVWIGSSLAVLGTAMLLGKQRASLGVLFVLISILALRPFGFERGDLAALHPSTFWDSAAKTGRILTHETANQNLLTGYDSLTVFDPVLNSSFAQAMTENFHVKTPEFNPQPTEQILSQKQVAILGLLGVTHLQGYLPSVKSQATPTNGGLQQLAHTLFPGIKVSQEVAQRAEHLCYAGDFIGALATLSSERSVKAKSIQRQSNSFVLDFPHSAASRPDEQVLIVPLAFSNTWTIAGASSSVFCRYISRWDGTGAEKSRIEVLALPSGLMPAIAVSLIAILGLFAGVVLTYRRKEVREI
jgi:hypothetical protein